jgi:hypothetical protein
MWEAAEAGTTPGLFKGSRKNLLSPGRARNSASSLQDGTGSFSTEGAGVQAVAARTTTRLIETATDFQK